MTPTPASYPAHRAADVALRSGASIRLRPLCPDDERALLAFLVGLSDESRGFRFFSGAADLGAAAHRATDVDYADRYGVVAVTGDGHTILAHGMYARDGATSGEVAFAVADRLQGERIATTMLAHLAEAARSVGIERFWAEVLPQNHRMVDLFRDSGFTVTVRAKPHALIMTMPTELDADARRRYDERDAVAAAAAVAASCVRARWRWWAPRRAPDRWAARFCATCSLPASPATCMRSAPAAGSWKVSSYTAQCETCRATWISRSSRSRRTPSSTWHATARPRASVRSSSYRPASPRPAPAVASASGS